MAEETHRSEEFELFFKAHVGDVRAFCSRRADPVLAEDAVAQTFEIAWRRRDDIPKQSRAWLLGVALRVLANLRRADRRHRGLVERLAAERASEPALEADVPPVLEALGRLSRVDQEALMLAAWEGLRSREAARVLGCSPVAFRLRLHRARRRLADALGEVERRPTATIDTDGMLVRVGETRS
jgi:RNA polymerase sigma-70 factor (ECF subfamily)